MANNESVDWQFSGSDEGKAASEASLSTYTSKLFALCDPQGKPILPPRGIASTLKNWVRHSIDMDTPTLEDAFDRLESFCDRHSISGETPRKAVNGVNLRATIQKRQNQKMMLKPGYLRQFHRSQDSGPLILGLLSVVESPFGSEAEGESFCY
ncbi:hypothetical protein F2Q69_00009448 [Brassica cretica]|uniref:Uncharacterized protein n=1 Tax=Brassica cretica TaxID=69181 RepID=A0A8S9NXR7_BRACR|nr:hypothetical protein F2Q69_00009448 [Brassica cretica]